MPDRCLVGGCSKVANFSSDWSAVVALHKFPTASSVRQSWIAFVRQRRPGWIFVQSFDCWHVVKCKFNVTCTSL